MVAWCSVKIENNDFEDGVNVKMLNVSVQIFKMWNKELYVREQQDAYEFFTSLVDQLDEHLKVIS